MHKLNLKFSEKEDIMQQQVMTQGQTGQVMKEPPAVLTSKDLMYLKDAMSWELLAAKKCAHWASEAQIPAVKTELEQAGKMHQKHYDLLLSHVKTNGTM